MSPLRILYLILAIIGAAWPMRFFYAWGAEHGMSIVGLLDAWRVNDATRGLTADLLIAGVALTIWIIAETRMRKNWSALWAIPATFCVGVSFGLPLYLLLRTRQVR